jgi:hypothetical protein
MNNQEILDNATSNDALLELLEAEKENIDE